MKLKHYCTILTLLLFSLSNNVFSQTTQEQLIGVWTFDYDASLSKIDTKAKAHIEKMEISRRQRLESTYKGRTMTFGADGNYLQQLADGRKALGKWVLSENKKDILITNPQGKELHLKIKNLNATSLVLTPSDIGKGKPMLSDWYFSKN